MKLFLAGFFSVSTVVNLVFAAQTIPNGAGGQTALALGTLIANVIMFCVAVAVLAGVKGY